MFIALIHTRKKSREIHINTKTDKHRADLDVARDTQNK